MKSHEVAVLIILTENQLTSEESLAIYNLKAHMNKAGYTDVATSVGIKSLVKKGFISTFIVQDYNGNDYSATRLTDDGDNWIMSSRDQLVFRIEPKTEDDSNKPIADDLPF
ncbi:hypothetical protein BH10BAC2_BH10BAC2_11920 [soil metagenome]